MRRIVLPTDFGPASDAQIVFAGKLSEAFAIPVHVLHIQKCTADTEVLPPSFGIESVHLKALVDAAAICARHTSQRVTQEAKQTFGAIESSILDEVKPGDLLVMGQTYSRGMWRIILGDITEGVLEKAKCPILIVPHGYQYQDPHHFGLAIDEQQLQSEARTTLGLLLKRFGAKLDVFHRSPGGQNRPGSELREVFPDTEIHFHYDEAIGSLTDYLLDVCRHSKASWMCMVHHHRPWWKELLTRNHSEKVAELTPIPLLVLPD